MKDHSQATGGTTVFSATSQQNRLISLTVVRLRRLTQSVTRVLTLNGRINNYALFAILLGLLTAMVVLAYYFNRPQPQVESDTRGYLSVAYQIQAHGQLVDPDRVPGFPLLMVLIFALTGQNNLMAVSLANAVLFILTTLEIYVIALLIFRKGWVAFLVGLLVGTNVILLLFVKPVQSEALTLWLLVSLALIAVLFVCTLQARYLWLAGGFTLALFFTRPEWNYVPIPLFAYLLLVATGHGVIRRLWTHALVCLLLIHAFLGTYIYINATQNDFVGVTSTQNINAWGKVLNYNMQDEAPPEYATVRRTVDIYMAHGISDPQDIAYHDPQLGGHYYALAGAYARAIIIHHPVEFLAKSVPLALSSLTIDPEDGSHHVDPTAQFGRPLVLLYSASLGLYGWNQLFPICAALWLTLLCWRRTARSRAVQAMGAINLLVLYGLIFTTVAGIQDYARLHLPFNPLLILVVWASLLIPLPSMVRAVVHNGLGVIWTKLDEVMNVGRGSASPALDRPVVTTDEPIRTSGAKRPACITRDSVVKANHAP